MKWLKFLQKKKRHDKDGALVAGNVDPVLKRTAILVSACLLASTLWVGVASPALAQDNAAVAVNTKDGSSIFKFAFNIHHSMGDVVDNTNAAVAYASCEECTTIAVAIQVILVMGDPEVVTPTNLALALNYECTLCYTMASAYQFVLSTDGPVHFTAEGNQTIAELRNQLRELLKSGASIEEIAAQLDVIVDQLAEVLATQMVPAGNSSDDEDSDDDAEEDSPSDTDDTEEEPTEEEPTESVTPAPSESVTTEPSPSPAVESSSTP